MIKTKIVKVNKEFSDKILCDFCGRKFKCFMDVCFEGAHFVLTFGYPSKFDDERWEFDICDECAEKLKEKRLL